MEEKLSFENDDILGRKKIAENITRIIENSDEFNVIAIDSSWGTGKTTFIKKWETMLHSEAYEGKFKTLYFNAWKNDYMKDPFAALLTAIDNEESELKESFKSAVSTGIGITKGITDIFLKLATAGAIGTEEFTKIKDEFFKGIKEEQTNRDNFIEEIEKIASGESKTIFFIDEIDRCRPTFAIELLETIKHLFKAKNIYFIISVDKIQLAHSIKSLYGEGMDADGYLRRFFDLEFNMPIEIGTYIDYKFNSISSTNIIVSELNICLRELIKLEVYSLRDIDKTIKYCKLVIPSLDNNYMFKRAQDETEKYFMIVCLSILINLKIKHGEIYNSIINRNYNKSDIERYLQKINLKESKEIKRVVEYLADINTELDDFVRTYLITIKDFNRGDEIIGNTQFIIGKINIARMIQRYNFHNNFISILELINDFKVNK